MCVLYKRPLGCCHQLHPNHWWIYIAVATTGFAKPIIVLTCFLNLEGTSYTCLDHRSKQSHGRKVRKPSTAKENRQFVDLLFSRRLDPVFCSSLSFGASDFWQSRSRKHREMLDVFAGTGATNTCINMVQCLSGNSDESRVDIGIGTWRILLAQPFLAQLNR